MTKGRILDKTDAEIFKKAIVLVAVNDILAPCRYRKTVDLAIVHVIEDPDGPQKYDWTGYTYQALVAASRQFKAQLALNNRGATKSLEGCTIFLYKFHYMPRKKLLLDTYNELECDLVNI